MLRPSLRDGLMAFVHWSPPSMLLPCFTSYVCISTLTCFYLRSSFHLGSYHLCIPSPFVQHPNQRDACSGQRYNATSNKSVKSQDSRSPDSKSHICQCAFQPGPVPARRVFLCTTAHEDPDAKKKHKRCTAGRSLQAHWRTWTVGLVSCHLVSLTSSMHAHVKKQRF